MIDSPVEWFQNKMTELENNFKRKGALLDMKSVVLNSEKNVLFNIVNNIRINPIFEFLITCDDQDIELHCIIIFELLSQLTGEKLLEMYGDSINKCLLHPSDEVKETILRLLQKTINNNMVEYLLNNHILLIVDAAECLASSKRSTAQGAITMFIKIGSFSQGLHIIFSTLVLKKLKEIMSVSDTARFRVYEIVVAVSKLSAESLSFSVSSGLMGSLISEISSTDILIQLNALELLSNLASSNHGLSYLHETDVIQKLVDKLLKLNEEPLALALLPGMVEFFGNLCTLQPECFTKEYPQIMDLFFNSLETNDEVLLGVIFTAVGKIGSTLNGRLVLNKYDRQIKYFFKKIGKILTIKSELSISAINSLCELIKDINGEINVNKIAKNWFESITPDALESITILSKLPFIEFRLAGFAILKVLATQQWGIEKLSNFPGMIEFLTDRSIEFNKDCKQTKYEIVFNMIQHPVIEQSVSPQVLLTLKEFLEEGPFYVPVQVEMATEGAE